MTSKNNNHSQTQQSLGTQAFDFEGRYVGITASIDPSSWDFQKEPLILGKKMM